MNMNHSRIVDLNLLVIFECIYRHLNVSNAASEMGITQSAISHSLTRLRNHYRDPLFVRVSKGVAPTEFARGIRADVEKFVNQATLLSEKTDSFDPSTAKGRITIATTEYFEIVIGTKLYMKLRREAPGVQLSVRPTFDSLPKQKLEDGSYDLAIAGFYKNLPEGFYQQTLFSDSFATAFRKGHPKIKDKIKIDEYFSCDHTLITLQGDFKDGLSRMDKGKRSVRNIPWGSSSFLSPGWIISETDLILTAPSLLLEKYKTHFPIEVQKCPVDVPPISIQMVWHAITNQNPLRKWIRGAIKDICTDL